MFEKLNIDWDLLHRHKLALFALLSRSTRTGRVTLTRSEQDAIEGIVNLLDALQDDAVAAGLWAFSVRHPGVSLVRRKAPGTDQSR